MSRASAQPSRRDLAASWAHSRSSVNSVLAPGQRATTNEQLCCGSRCDRASKDGRRCRRLRDRPIPTFDLDVFVLLAFDWALRNGYREQAEHIIIAGITVQVIPA